MTTKTKNSEPITRRFNGKGKTQDGESSGQFTVNALLRAVQKACFLSTIVLCSWHLISVVALQFWSQTLQ